MFCRQCAEYVSNQHQKCPHCGSPLSDSAQPQLKYYCKRCKRRLLSRICPIHGIESTVRLDLLVNKAASAAQPVGASNTTQKNIPAFQAPASRQTGQKPPLKPAPEPLKPSAPPLKTVIAPEPAVPEINLKLLSDRLQAMENASPGTDKNGSPAGVAAGGPGKAPHGPQPGENFLKTAAPQSGKSKKSSSGQSDSLRALIEKELDLWRTARKERRAKAAAKAQRPPAAALRDQKMPGTAKSFQPGSAKPLRSGRRSGVYVIVTVLLVAALGSGWYVFYYPDFQRKSLLSRAEVLFNASQYDAARALYFQYERQFPRGAEISLVHERLEHLRSLDRERLEKQIFLYDLMKKAADAFNAGRYLEPAEDNANHYIVEILQIDPDFTPAIELRNRMLDHFYQQAAMAFEGDQYDAAVTFYQNILALKPDDPVITNALDRALKLKYVYGMLDEVSGLEATKNELKNLEREKERLKNQIQQERNRLKEISRQIETLNQGAAENSTGKQGNPAGQPLPQITAVSAGMASSPANVASLWEEELGISLVSLGGSVSASSETPKLVEETLLDGGKKEYLHREKIQLPANYKAKEMTLILGECIVGADGQVETVSLISPAEDERLNRLAVEAFKKYRFKPATYNGRPVRFKSIEVLSIQ